MEVNIVAFIILQCRHPRQESGRGGAWPHL